MQCNATLSAAAGDDSLEELTRLPEGASIIARTNNLAELKSQKEKLSSVNVVSRPPSLSALTPRSSSPSPRRCSSRTFWASL